ncbi:MAG: ATP-binding protein [Bacteroidales bacterium]|jgi:hypothetical protein
MSYVKKIFNKDILDLNISDLRSFFELEQEETSVLEFKSGDVEIIDLYKEITAFLNTEGGLLIIGTPQEKKQIIGDNIKTVCFGELTYSKFRNKDWLYQKISSNIVPAPSGLKIFEYIDVAGSIFVIDIPQSDIPPHQCSSDGRYYIRLEREAKPAPHGLVQALFQKRRAPKLDAKIRINKINTNVDELHISLYNRSRIPADKLSCIIDIYNTNGIETKAKLDVIGTIDELLGQKFSVIINATQVLVQVLSFPIDLIVTHRLEEYIIAANFWCIDADFDFKFWTYDPINQKIICEDKLNYERVNFIEEVKRVTKIIIPEIEEDLNYFDL